LYYPESLRSYGGAAQIAWLEIRDAGLITVAKGSDELSPSAGLFLNTRTVSLVCAGAICLNASGTLLTSGAVAQITTAGIVDIATVRLVAETFPAAKQDSAERSARSIECAQKADAQGLPGKTRKHFLRECKRGS
jgi:hypothetical protein